MARQQNNTIEIVDTETNYIAYKPGLYSSELWLNLFVIIATLIVATVLAIKGILTGNQWVIIAGAIPSSLATIYNISRTLSKNKAGNNHE